MKNYLKSYVEKKYFDGTKFECTNEEIKDRDALLVDTEDGMVGFRFYDIEFTYDEKNNVYNAVKKNISGWVLIGKKLSLNDLAIRYGDNNEYLKRIAEMKKAHINYVCEIVDDVFITMEKNDYMYAELVDKKTRGEK